MAKNTFLDFDTTASNNTDIAGIGIQGSNAVKNFDDAFRTIMAILRRDLDNGTVYASKSSGYTAVANDNNAFHRYSAAATIALTAAATLGADWHYTVFADGGDLVIDPNASELINGATTLRVPDGSYAYIICTGTAFYASVVSTRVYGDCRLTLSGGNLLLSRVNGRRLTINGVGEIVPSAGITLSASGLTPSTLYYIYAYMNSGTMTLEASTTVPVADTATGVQIKTGDATRSLVGMARPVTGPAWADTIGQRFVRSWYNRDKPRGASAFTADRSTSSGSLVELNSEIRNEFLTWADENIQANFSGWGSTSVGGPAILKIVLDANTADLARCGTGLSSSANMSIAGTNTPGLGYHYVTMYATTSAGSMTIFGTGTAPGLLNTTIV